VTGLPRPVEPRDVRAWIALWASIGGAVALTFAVGGLVLILWIGGWHDDTAILRLGFLGKIALLTLAGALVVLISLGFAINKRSLKISKDGIDASGGDDPTPGPSVKITTTTETAP
jgi:hypothetical protein